MPRGAGDAHRPERLQGAADQLNAIGTKGIGEIGIVGSPAAVLNAVWHATGVGVRELPITPDRLLGGLPEHQDVL